MFRTKKHRLHTDYYKSKTVVFTLCLTTDENIANEQIFETLNEILIKELQKDDCLLHIWLLMPDHCHMIVEAGDKTENVLRTLNRFKQNSGYWFYKSKLNIRWQKSFYDHILRDEKDVENQFYYILNNPVRKGIVESWKEYPYKFSMIYNLDEL